MAGISQVRNKPDPVAIATKGQMTSKIKDQESSDLPKGEGAADDAPRIISARD